MKEKDLRRKLKALGLKDEQLDVYVKELKNSSDFEDNLRKLINVDIYKGIKIFKELQGVESKSTKKRLVKSAYEYTGIKYISKRIQHYLIESGVAKSVMVEYSLLSSTLNPQDPDKLQCCSFIITEDQGFRKGIENYYTACIAATAQKHDGISIYQHPKFLFDINPQKSYVITKQSGGDITSDVEIVADPNNKFEPIGKKGDLFITAFPLTRSYVEMTRGARDYQGGADLEDIQKFLHLCCHNAITCRDGNESKSSIYVSFPIHGSLASNQLDKYKVGVGNPLQGIGACFIYFESNPNAEQLDDFHILVNEIIERIVYEVGKVIRFISSNYLFNLGLALQDNARKESLKSAKAAIMSRNMSHNLGSHVMSYLKQHLSSVKDLINDKVLSELYEGLDDLPEKYTIIDEKGKESKGNKEELALPFLLGLGQFVSYLQERQDFIATIATDYIPYYAEVNFKDFIYDELNPDKRVERHAERTSSLKTDNILLGNIARSEGLGRSTSPTRPKKANKDNGNNSLNDIILKFRSFNGDSPQNERERNDLKDMRLYNVSLPGGVVGRQAIFSIVENVIRNAAKHGNWRECQKLELTFDIYSKDDFMRASNNDAYEEDKDLSLRQVFERFYCNAIDSDDLYFVTLTDNLKFNGDTLVKLRHAIAGRYVNEKGEMENANKGLKEMRISASWLRSIYDDSEIRIDSGDLRSDKNWNYKKGNVAPVLYARICTENGIGHLQYIFCLVKPKKVAVISNTFAVDSNYNKSDFIMNCWGAYTPQQFMDLYNKSYEFVVFDDDSNDKKRNWYEDIRRVSSSRLLRLRDLPELSSLLEDIRNESMDFSKIEKMLYKHMAMCKDSTNVIIVSDQTASEKVCDSQKNKVVQINANGEDGRDYLVVSDGIDDDLIDKVVELRTTKTDQDYSTEHLCIYRSHYETTENFSQLMGSDKFDDFEFIESITGNNSTDRLVRNESLDDIWYYKHLHAMKERVAIFDERIFAKAFSLEEADLAESEFVPESVTKKNLAELKRKYKSDSLFSEEEKKAIIKCKEPAQLESLLLQKSIASTISINRKVTSTILPTLYEQKNIFIFTIVKDPQHNDKFNIYGICSDSHKVIRNKLNKYVSTCVKLYEIRWNGNSLRIRKIRGEKHLFDSISIHQGLLDKLYEAFNISDNDIVSKERLTKDFFNYFCSQSDEVIEYYDEKDHKKYFLPKMCIHSGRSKPSENNMPQHLPFIQYASIEHAVLDCKYSLVELLDFARYEP